MVPVITKPTTGGAAGAGAKKDRIQSVSSVLKQLNATRKGATTPTTTTATGGATSSEGGAGFVPPPPPDVLLNKAGPAAFCTAPRELSNKHAQVMFAPAHKLGSQYSRASDPLTNHVHH